MKYYAREGCQCEECVTQRHVLVPCSFVKNSAEQLAAKRGLGLVHMSEGIFGKTFFQP